MTAPAASSKSTSATRECAFCGHSREELTLPNPFTGDPIHIGFLECDCEGAVRAREEEARAEARREAAKATEAARKRLQRAGIPPRFQAASHPLADELAAKVAEGGSLYLWGGNGTGKTTLAAAIARRLLDRQPLMIGSVQLLIELQSTYGTPDREADILEKYSSAPILIIDDLGKEQQTDWTASRLYAIVDARYGRMLPTVVTSNFRLSDMLGRMRDQSTAMAIVSRLSGVCEQIQVAGHDRRLQ